MPQYRLKPVVVRAEKFMGVPEEAKLFGFKRGVVRKWVFKTTEGLRYPKGGDWVVYDVDDRKYLRTEDEFYRLYERVPARRRGDSDG